MLASVLYCLFAVQKTEYETAHVWAYVFPSVPNVITQHTCGNKMPTRCNRGFYCRSYCLLNMFRAPLCPSSGAQEYYIVVDACGISCCKDVKSNSLQREIPQAGTTV